MRNLITFFILLSFISFSGCATIFTGANETFEFVSEPAGAKVIVNDVEKGITPLRFSVKKGDVYVVQLSKEGYMNKTYRIGYSVSTGWLILDILTGFIGVVVDALTENWFIYEKTYYKTILEKLD